MTCVVAHPLNPKKVLAGAAGGGVWRRDFENGGWESAAKGLESLNIGSLALDTHDRNHPVVYCGTGEANLSADGHPGAGLFRSDDWGTQWERVAIPTKDRIPGRIGTIAVDPTNSNHLFIGGVGHRSDEGDRSGGLFVSNDRGSNWSRVDSISKAPYWCHAVIFGRAPAEAIYAAITARGAQSGIWRSRDSGVTWNQLSDGLPSSEKIFRTNLALAPSEPACVYAFAANRAGLVLGVYQSRDEGDSWREIGHDHFANELFLNNASAIVVHPNKPEYVLCGGVDLHLWYEGRWFQITSWRSKKGQAEYAHADHHCLLMPEDDLVYDMNDGGMAISEDGGWNWNDRSEGLVTTMFYDIDVAPFDSTGTAMGGGTQDNGTLVTLEGPGQFQEVARGDGGWMAFDHKTLERFYSTIYGARVYLHHNYPTGWREDISPPEESWIQDLVWLSPLKMHPQRPDTVYFGTTKIWLTEPAPQQETNWHALSDDLDGSPITALEIAANPAYLYAGTENGGLFFSEDSGASWSGDLSGRVLPGAIITRIRAHPKEPSRVLVCVGRIGHPHVFRSNNRGQIWEAVGQNLPDMPFRAMVIDPDNPEVVYLGSDVGVYVSKNFGESWLNISGDLPKTEITDLVIHKLTRALYAATYGRGIWRTKIS